MKKTWLLSTFNHNKQRPDSVYDYNQTLWGYEKEYDRDIWMYEAATLGYKDHSTKYKHYLFRQQRGYKT